jgi:hypothetical protein
MIWTCGASTTSSIASTSLFFGRIAIKPLTLNSSVGVLFPVSELMTIASERLTHLTLRVMGAQRIPYSLRCPAQGALLRSEVGRVGSCSGNNRILDASDRGGPYQNPSVRLIIKEIRYITVRNTRYSRTRLGIVTRCVLAACHPTGKKKLN